MTRQRSRALACATAQNEDRRLRCGYGDGESTSCNDGWPTRAPLGNKACSCGGRRLRHAWPCASGKGQPTDETRPVRDRSDWQAGSGGETAALTIASKAGMPWRASGSVRWSWPNVRAEIAGWREQGLPRPDPIHRLRDGYAKRRASRRDSDPHLLFCGLRQRYAGPHALPVQPFRRSHFCVDPAPASFVPASSPRSLRKRKKGRRMWSPFSILIQRTCRGPFGPDVLVRRDRSWRRSPGRGRTCRPTLPRSLRPTAPRAASG